MTTKVVLITGAATGIGLATAKRFFDEGFAVAGTYFAESQFAAEAFVASGLPRAGERILWLPLNLRQDASIEAVHAATLEKFGQIDVLVNCASKTSLPAVAGFLECSREQMDDILETNLRGTIVLSQLVARSMVAAGKGGNVVHVASVGAYAAQEHASIYCTTKAAVASLAQGMALELSRYGIRVNAVSPGDINTTANAKIAEELVTAGATGRYLRNIPIGRRGRPEEIAAAIFWVASDEASYVTGSNLLADGGFLAY